MMFNFLRSIDPGAMRLVVVGVVISIIASVMALAQPLMLGVLVNSVAEGDGLVVPLSFLIGLFVGDAVFSALQAYILGRAGESFVYSLRKRAFKRLIGGKISALKRADRGDMQTRLINDSSLARIAISDSITQILSNAFMVLAGFTIMAILDIRLFGVMVLGIGFAGSISFLLAKRVRKVAMVNREDTGALGSVVQRVLNAITTVKAFRAEHRESAAFDRGAYKAKRSGIGLAALSSLFGPTINVGTQVSLAAVIGLGMSWVASGDLQVAILTAFLMYLVYLVSPLVLVFMAFGDLQQGRAAVDRLTWLLGIPQELEPDRDESVVESVNNLEHSDEALRFTDVCYKNSESTDDVLNHVSFSLEPNTIGALVGPSGAGKSTILDLIERFVIPDSGHVEISGMDIANMELSELRSRVAYVEQEPVLLPGTIRDNVSYGKPAALSEEIDRALSLANVADVVNALPEGVDSPLGEGGIGLSGGEKQRLALARAILHSPDVLLLDEVTSNLDEASEVLVLDSLSKLKGSMSVLMVAHRPSTVAAADSVIWLSNGEILDRGAHSGVDPSGNLEGHREGR